MRVVASTLVSGLAGTLVSQLVNVFKQPLTYQLEAECYLGKLPAPSRLPGRLYISACYVVPSPMRPERDSGLVFWRIMHYTTHIIISLRRFKSYQALYPPFASERSTTPSLRNGVWAQFCKAKQSHSIFQRPQHADP